MAPGLNVKPETVEAATDLREATRERKEGKRRELHRCFGKDEGNHDDLSSIGIEFVKEKVTGA